MNPIKQKYIEKINNLAKNQEPFLFIIDYELNNIIVEKIDGIDSNNILFSVNELNKTLMYLNT